MIISISRLKLAESATIEEMDFGVILSISRLKLRKKDIKTKINFGVILSISRLKHDVIKEEW